MTLSAHYTDLWGCFTALNIDNVSNHHLQKQFCYKKYIDHPIYILVSQSYLTILSVCEFRSLLIVLEPTEKQNLTTSS